MYAAQNILPDISAAVLLPLLILIRTQYPLCMGFRNAEFRSMKHWQEPNSYQVLVVEFERPIGPWVAVNDFATCWKIMVLVGGRCDTHLRVVSAPEGGASARNGH